MSNTDRKANRQYLNNILDNLDVTVTEIGDGVHHVQDYSGNPLYQGLQGSSREDPQTSFVKFEDISEIRNNTIGLGDYSNSNIGLNIPNPQQDQSSTDLNQIEAYRL